MKRRVSNTHSVSLAAIAGYSLIELVVFIVVLGILGVALFTGLSTALMTSAVSPAGIDATQLAQQRMELILAQKRRLGFAGFVSASFDPCTSAPPSTQPVCTSIPAGYTVSSTLSTNWGGNTNYKVITVTVTGKEQAALVALVANY